MRILVFAFAAIAVTAGCQQKRVPTDNAGTVIADGLAGQGINVMVTCPTAIQVKGGESFTCDAHDDDGMTFSVTVKRLDGQGHISFKPDGTVVKPGDVTAAVKERLPDATVTCPKKVVVLPPGKTMLCDVANAGETARLEVKGNADDTISYAVLPPRSP